MLFIHSNSCVAANADPRLSVAQFSASRRLQEERPMQARLTPIPDLSPQVGAAAGGGQP